MWRRISSLMQKEFLALFKDKLEERRGRETDLGVARIRLEEARASLGLGWDQPRLEHLRPPVTWQAALTLWPPRLEEANQCARISPLLRPILDNPVRVCYMVTDTISVLASIVYLATVLADGILLPQREQQSIGRRGDGQKT